jgi:NAD(P)-dependent dehydrogenase (short-subunit alcohol dehydrogenase family)
MELGLKNCSVLITGGSKGIGLACARAFLDEGARVAIVSRDRRNLDIAAEQLGKITLIAADLTRADDAKRMARELEAKAKGTTVEQVLEQGQARVPLGRYADPKDIASVMLFLASDQAAYVTGAVIPMDGGINPII